MRKQSKTKSMLLEYLWMNLLEIFKAVNSFFLPPIINSEHLLLLWDARDILNILQSTSHFTEAQISFNKSVKSKQWENPDHLGSQCHLRWCSGNPNPLSDTSPGPPIPSQSKAFAGRIRKDIL